MSSPLHTPLCDLLGLRVPILLAGMANGPSTPGLAAAEKWDRMRQFDNVLERQIAANMMPAGTLIIANVPLASDVYREQAVSSNQTTAQLMAAILTRAAGR